MWPYFVGGVIEISAKVTCMFARTGYSEEVVLFGAMLYGCDMGRSNRVKGGNLVNGEIMGCVVE